MQLGASMASTSIIYSVVCPEIKSLLVISFCHIAEKCCGHSLAWPSNRCWVSVFEYGWWWELSWSALTQYLHFFFLLLILMDYNLYSIHFLWNLCRVLLGLLFSTSKSSLSSLAPGHPFAERRAGGFEGRAAALVRSSEGLWGRATCRTVCVLHVFFPPPLW